MQSKESVYFPGLNVIRAIAATLVLIWHAMQLRHFLGLPPGPPVNEMAGFAVTMFFVLSGFLITYLLLREQERFGAISRRRFYLRRILRIWPAYFLAVTFGVAFLTWLLPKSPEHAGERVACYLFFVPN